MVNVFTFKNLVFGHVSCVHYDVVSIHHNRILIRWLGVDKIFSRNEGGAVNKTDNEKVEREIISAGHTQKKNLVAKST